LFQEHLFVAYTASSFQQLTKGIRMIFSVEADREKLNRIIPSPEYLTGVRS